MRRPHTPQDTRPPRQRRAATRSAAVARAVCGHLLLVLLEGAPIYVSRQSPAMQHRPALRIAQEASPTVRLAWQPETTIVVAPAVDIRSRVGGVAEHVAEGGPVGSVPADLSLVRPGANTVGELDVVIDEVAQQSAHRAPPLEDREHQPDDLPDPLVRIEGNLAGGLEHVAARQPQHQFAAFPVLLNLAQGRLADVDNRVAIAMAGLDLLRRRIARRKPHLRAHGRPPDLRTGAAG